jgi:hypothetical protein
MSNKKNNSNLYNIVYYYSKKGSITRDNVRALIIRFLMEYKKLNEFIKCYRHCHGEDYNVEDIFDDSVYFLFKRSDKIEDYFSKIPVSFEWGLCEQAKLCKASVWSDISNKWRYLTRDLCYEKQ